LPLIHRFYFSGHIFVKYFSKVKAGSKKSLVLFCQILGLFLHFALFFVFFGQFSVKKGIFPFFGFFCHENSKVQNFTKKQNKKGHSLSSE
jgi:hypothetical protein